VPLHPCTTSAPGPASAGDATLLFRSEPVDILQIWSWETISRPRRRSVLVLPKLPDTTRGRSWQATWKLHPVLVSQRPPAAPPTAAPSTAATSSTAATATDASRTVRTTVQSEWHVEHDGK
jgi:hypothetical protein